MTATIPPAALGWRRRRFRLFLVAGGLLLLIVYAGLDLWAGHRVNVAIARLEKQVGSLDENTLRRSPVAVEDNRARVVKAALALTVRVPKSVPDAPNAYSRFIKSGASGPVPADLRAFVEANRAALRVAEDARARTQSDWEIDYAYDGPRPPLLDLRTLSNAIYVDALLDLEAGRLEDAAKTIATGLSVCASLSREPDLLVQLFRIGGGMQQFEAVHRLVVQSEPSKASLEELARRLAENSAPDPARMGLVSELKHFNAALTRVESGRPGAGSQMADLLGISGSTRRGYDSPFWLGPLLRLSRPYVRLVRTRYLRQVGDLLDLQAGPRPHPAFPPFAATTRRSWMTLTQADYFSAGLARSIDTADRFNSARGAAEVAVALRRFRLDHASYPDALSALVPVYLATLPIDPLTGQPLVYQRDGAGFQLHAQQDGSTDPLLKVAALDWSVPK